MEMWQIILIVILGIIAFVLISYACVAPYIAKRIYNHFFVREDNWVHDRMTPFYNEAIDHVFYDEGWAFVQKHKDKIKELEITNDGLKLCGVYFDFGKKNTVVIVPGRKGTAYFAMYQGQIYENTEFNILSLDPRSNGFSEGKYLTAGIRESDDLIKWSKLLHDEYHQEAIFFHGICIGGATAMMALAREDCPDYMIGVIAEGPFYNFKKMFQNHVHDSHGPSFPVDIFMVKMFKKYAGVDIIKDSPINAAKILNKPILVFQCKNDKFAIYKQTMQLFEKIKYKDKKIVVVENSSHSHIMYHYRDLYTEESLKFSHEVLKAYENKNLSK